MLIFWLSYKTKEIMEGLADALGAMNIQQTPEKSSSEQLDESPNVKQEKPVDADQADKSASSSSGDAWQPDPGPSSSGASDSAQGIQAFKDSFTEYMKVRIYEHM